METSHPFILPGKQHTANLTARHRHIIEKHASMIERKGRFLTASPETNIILEKQPVVPLSAARVVDSQQPLAEKGIDYFQP